MTNTSIIGVVVLYCLFVVRRTICLLISHHLFYVNDLAVKNLTHRRRDVSVQKPTLNALLSRSLGIIDMHPLVQTAGAVYVESMKQRFGLINKDGTDVAIIRKTVLHGAMLNPLSGKHCCGFVYCDLRSGTNDE